jgi:AraC-like DNA-binding protein
MSRSSLFVNRFAVSKSNSFVYDQSFALGVNIIRGVNGTGKSTIADLLAYALGAVVTEWTKEQLACDWVIAEVSINSVSFCFKRQIVETGQARMEIFEGSFFDAMSDSVNWAQYSMRRSADRHSYSQQIFELLGLPRHKTDDSKNLTLHQIFRLMYVDQLSATAKLLKEDKEYDNVTFRRAIGDYLLGIDDLEAHNLRQDLILANKEFEKLNGELNAIYKLFGNDVSLINESALNNEIKQIENRIQELAQKKKEVLIAQSEELDELTNAKSSKLLNEIDQLSCKKQELDALKSELSIELIDTELFAKSLTERKLHLEESKLTSISLGEILFKYCPACLEPLIETEGKACCLCKTERTGTDRDIAYIQMLNDLNFQLRESESLIREFREDIDVINSKLPSIKRRIEEAKLEYRELEIATNSKDAIISEIASEVGFCRSQILALEDKRGHVAKVESLRLGKEEANGIIIRLQDSLEQVSARQADRYNFAYSSIEAIASRILSQDGSYEPTFDEVEEVSFDFSKDRMFVNGRSKFSASSMVVMKNSIRLAIFLHAVDDDLSRLPNFMIMDNVEDKGMVDERSHNFQHIIVQECQKLKSDYQIIFTTSMIAPDLDGTELCVGPMYEKGMHTLEFN